MDTVTVSPGQLSVSSPIAVIVARKIRAGQLGRGLRTSNSRGRTFAASTIRTKRLFTPLGGSAMRRRFFTSFSRASWDQQSSELLEHVSRGEWPSTQCCDRRLREVLATYPDALNARNRRNSTSSSLDVVLKRSTTTLVRRAPYSGTATSKAWFINMFFSSRSLQTHLFYPRDQRRGLQP